MILWHVFIYMRMRKQARFRENEIIPNDFPSQGKGNCI